jgi:hypothetical protein
MCMRLLETLAHFKWPGDGIYIAHKLEVAVCSCWVFFCVGVGSSGARTSVQPVYLSSEIAAELLTWACS